MRTEEICIEVAAQQHGLLSRTQALEAGASRSAMARLAGSPRWSVPQPHVLQHAAVACSWETRLMAAVLASEDVVISHRAAARLHGFRSFEETEVVEGSVRGRCTVALRDVVLHHPRCLPDCDIVRLGPFRSTGRVRTLVDLAGTHERTAYIALVDDVMSDSDMASAAVHARALALREGRRNVALLARLTASDAARQFRSQLERRAATVFSRGGLPPCAWNARIESRDGRLLGVVDCCWMGPRLVVELDGLRFHSSAEDRRKDQARQNGLTIEGYRVLRFTWRDIVEQPERVVREIGRALRWAGDLATGERRAGVMGQPGTPSLHSPP